MALVDQGISPTPQKALLSEVMQQMNVDQYDSVYAEVTVHEGWMLHLHVVTDSTIKNVLVMEKKLLN